ncbi:hypothetical protein LPTSP4_22740 [Leptospira ryugenii]|uniref:Uncharacterized protein n=1 Tax=Leptospira ryugenii TaxID=1917863 RepID=A0A2P2E1I2_9LEPT|nr:hypothetical protein [Leptospira ryugenii]GBF50747.1 hypothetical protein LPTSP4_22740 [Leptospira ryugenii]
MKKETWNHPIAYYESHGEEFSAFVADYIFDALTEEEEAHLAKLVKGSTQLHRTFQELSKMDSQIHKLSLTIPKKKTSPFRKYQLATAALLFLGILWGVYVSLANKQVEDPQISAQFTLIRSLGICQTKSDFPQRIMIETKEMSGCDFEFKRLRRQRIRILPHSLANISFENGEWKVDVVKGVFYITTMESSLEEKLVVYLGEDYTVQFLGTSVYISKTENTKLSIFEGEVLFSHLKKADSQRENLSIKEGEELLLSSPQNFSLKKAKKEKNSNLRNAFNSLREDANTNNRLSVDQISPKKIQSVPGNKVILKTGLILEVDEIWQDEDIYILNRKGKLQSISVSEIRSILF